MKNKKAFTLVELIIVIAIIAILSVLAYLEITKRVKISRDTSRTADLTTIEKALNIALVEKSKVPLPDENITITASGDIIGYQGVFGETAKDFIGNISKAPQDGADKIYYTYYVDKTQKYFQLLGFAENKISYNPNNANAVDYLQRYILTRGNNLGIIVDGSQTPVNQLLTGFDVMTGIVNDTGYTAIFDSNNKLSGTGQTLQWLRSNINNGGAGYNSPSNCPTGFIPVPGNKDFNQPGFCVAKYEMKQREGTAGNAWTVDGVRTNKKRNTGNSEICGPSNLCANGLDASTKLDGKIESKPEGMPVVRLNQITAIEACSKMGNGYHLITNNERMTIARSVELQGENRTSGIVGSGGIYRGKNTWYDGIVGELDCNGGQDWNGVVNDASLVGLATSSACNLSNGRSKRSLKLGNNQRIWDFAGNVWEHTNKADTIDGSLYNSNDFYKSDVCNASNTRRAFATGALYDGTDTCSRTNSYRYNLIGPATPNLNANNGIGRILNSTISNNIFLRGGYGGETSNTGIFSLSVVRLGNSQNGNAGFRCAR